MIIGVTGGIGSGKSFVTKLLSTKLKSKMLSADEIVAQVVGIGGEAIDLIASAFGKDFIDDSGALNRKKMRELVFNNPHLKTKLENLTNPIINKTMHYEIDKINNPSEFIVIEIPLLYESKYWIDHCDFIVSVSCSRETQIKRIKNRNNFEEDLIKKIIDSQATTEQRNSIADFVVMNNDDGNTLDGQLNMIITTLTNHTN